MRDVLAIGKALADPSRLRILAVLRNAGELCVCQIVELIRLAPSTVSRHLSILEQAGLIVQRKDGRWVWCMLAGKGASPAARDAIRWTTRELAASEIVIRDAENLKTILAIDPETLCQRQSNGKSTCCSSAPATPAAAKSRKVSRARSSRT